MTSKPRTIIVSNDTGFGKTSKVTTEPPPSTVEPLRTNINVFDDRRLPGRRIRWRSWYDLSWTGATTDPAIGNGTLKGWYLLEDRWVDFYIELVTGSTTTYGSGAWIFSTLPVTPRTTRGIGLSTMYDSSSGTVYSGWCQVRGDELVLRPTVPSITTAGAHNGVAATVPFTWSTGDELVIEGRYRYSE